MDKDGEEILQHWIDRIKQENIFPDNSEFDKNKDFMTKNYQIKVECKFNNQNIRKIIEINEEVLDWYKNENKKKQENADKKLCECIREGECYIKRKDMFPI